MKTQDFPEKIRVKLGSRIQEARKKAGFTQMDVAKALGISQSLISDWEKGNAVPLAINIYQLSKLFQVSPLDFNPLDENDDQTNTYEETKTSDVDMHKEIQKIWEVIQRLEKTALPNQPKDVRT